jgi:hypothetical protein
MRAEERIAICRILTDLIKADLVIDSNEMQEYVKLCESYNIRREEEIKASSITLSEAVSLLKQSDRGLQRDLIGDFCDLSMSDGFCARPEALLLIGLSRCLEDPYSSAQILSIPQPVFNVAFGSVLYIESSTNEGLNQVINDNFRTLFKECQVVGFNFIYVPKVIEHYRSTDRKLTSRIVRFLSPALSDEGVENVINGLLSINTQNFCKDILCNKLGIKELRDTEPALLIKIGRSYVNDNLYANYLKINVDENIVKQMQKLLDTFSGMLSSDNINVSKVEEKKNQFLYHGFYKQLLDIYLIRRNVRSTVNVHPYKEEILMPDIDMKLTKLHRREKALYLLLLIVSKEGGINFNLPQNAKQAQIYEKRMRLFQNRYKVIYELFGGERGGAPDLTQAEIRRPIISCLRRSLAEISGVLYNANDYMINKDVDGYIKVNLDDKELFIFEPERGYVYLYESDIYRKIIDMR